MDGAAGPELREITPCGPASLAVAFRVLGIPVENHELDRLSDSAGVSNLYEMCHYARSKGLHADVASLPPKALVEINRIAVLCVRPDGAPSASDDLNHFIVFLGADPTGRWRTVDPLGISPFSGLVDAEALVRSWNGRALILSREPLPWPLERGWWLRRWSIAALWWLVAPLAFMAAVYLALRRKVLARREERASRLNNRHGGIAKAAAHVSVCAAGATLLVGLNATACSEHQEPPAHAQVDGISELVRERIVANLEEAARLLDRFDQFVLCTDDPGNILVHGLLGHGKDFAIRDGEQWISCLEWLLHRASWQQSADRQPLLRITDSGPVFRETSSDVNACEAHFGQTLFYMSETDICPEAATVKLDAFGDAQPLSVLVSALRRNVHEYAELSFCLPVILRWCHEDRWECRFGSEWTLNRLLQAHLEAEERSLACGGAHWRYALAFAVKGGHGRHFDRQVLDRASRRLDEILDATLTGIEPDGRIPDAAVVVPESMRFSHQAHTLEWLMVAVSDDILRSHAELHKAVAWAIREMSERWDTLSPRDLCHAAHALRLYRHRLESAI